MPDFGGVIKTIDKTTDMLRCVEKLTLSDVLVGVPKGKAPRKGESAPINNATLAYIHEFGSPAHNIPARPFLYPGLKRVRQQAIAMMRQGAIDCLRGTVNVNALLSRVGILARNAVVDEITDPVPPFAPLQPATIRARLRRTAAGRRKLRQIKKRGVSLTAWAAEIDPDSGSANIHPLIDTGQLRASITYVVREG